MKNERMKFNIFIFISTFARDLIEIFIPILLYKNGFSLHEVILYYFIVNIFGSIISYPLSYIAQKIKYNNVALIGIMAFAFLQILITNIQINIYYLILLALLYSIYKRGYWTARRYYIVETMPNKNISKVFSIILIIAQIGSIFATYLGSFLLDFVNLKTLTIISIIMFIVSLIPLKLLNETLHTTKKIRFRENFKRYSKTHLFIFITYESTNILTTLFPIYLLLYVRNNYTIVGLLSVISSVAIMIFSLIYGKIINKDKNYLVFSFLFIIFVYLLKINVTNNFILVLSFINGIATKMLSLSVNKIYFEYSKQMDSTNYNLIYQIAECLGRSIVLFPMLFINNIKVMICLTIFVLILNTIYIMFLKNKKKIVY